MLGPWIRHIQHVVAELCQVKVLISCQHLYSKKNTDVICISQLFGTSADHSFIAEITTLARLGETTICGLQTKEADPTLTLPLGL